MRAAYLQWSGTVICSKTGQCIGMAELCMGVTECHAIMSSIGCAIFGTIVQWLTKVGRANLPYR